jgi:hypothetical protein
MGRLAAYERHRHERRVAAAVGQVAGLQVQDAPLAMAKSALPAATTTRAVPQLDTVPAELPDAAPQDGPQDAIDSAEGLGERAAGDWLRIFPQGGWGRPNRYWPGRTGSCRCLQTEPSCKPGPHGAALGWPCTKPDGWSHSSRARCCAVQRGVCCATLKPADAHPLVETCWSRRAG